eukprot:TRINITY_DN2386_c0_g1_i2.p1 TRINITY_DN2386_c0_g1~~TRINITY_DN2386_c0_g1_i2.p1  ORF type:complete len:570 (+),score=143.41 TRINITY_DN2386_c0_g1_i2:102-1811(+)
MIRRPPRSTLSSSSAASDVYKRQVSTQSTGTGLSIAMGDDEEPLPEWPPIWRGAENDLVELHDNPEAAEVRQALQDAKQQLVVASSAVLEMRNKIAELKTYKVEPKCVQVIHACFLLNGTNPSEIEDWQEVRRRLTPEFFAGLTGFDHEQHAPSKQIESKLSKLMDQIDPESVKQSSEALLALYEWVTAGRKLLDEARQLPFKLRELAGSVPEELTGDVYTDYENQCIALELAPHPHLLPRKHCQRSRAEARAEEFAKDPKGKGKTDAVGESEEHVCLKVEVKGYRLDAGSMYALSKCLPVCTTCVEMSLWNADLDMSCFSHLAAVLPSTAVTKLSLDWSLRHLEAKSSSISLLVGEGTKLSSLSLRSNNLDAKVVEAICEGMETSDTITSLDLSSNSLGDAAAAPLLATLQQAGSTLTTLALNACDLTDGFAANLAQAIGLREYTEQEQSDVSEAQKAADDVIERNSTLKKGAEPEPVPSVPEMIVDEQGRALGAANRTLVEILLESNLLTIAGVIALADSLSHNGAVKVIYLVRNGVTPEQELQVCDPRVFLSETCLLYTSPSPRDS